MIVILSWYADGSRQPEVTFQNITYREASGLYGVGPLIEDVRNTQHKECRAWEVRDTNVHPLYDSTAKKEETQ